MRIMSIASLSILTFAAVGVANGAPMPAPDVNAMVKAADLIVVGTAGDVAPRQNEDASKAYFKIKVERAIKGGARLIKA